MDPDTDSESAGSPRIDLPAGYSGDDLAELLAHLAARQEADLDELLATTCPACGHRWRP